MFVSFQSPHTLYKPSKNLVTCKHALCVSLHGPAIQNCETPDEQCDYEVTYADLGSSMGVLVMDSFPFRFTNGSVLGPRLAFGWVIFLLLGFSHFSLFQYIGGLKSYVHFLLSLKIVS